MKKYIFIFAVLFYTLQSYAQIFSGFVGEHDYVFRYEPDTTIPVPPANDTVKYVLDINNDGVNDFVISTLYREGYQWYQEKRVIVEGLNGNQAAYFETDSCMTDDQIPVFVKINYPALELPMGLLINGDLNWTDSVVSLSYLDFNATWPTYLGYYCERESSLKFNDGFIAVRVFKSDTVLYGWIEMSDVDYNTCKIHAYACNRLLTGIHYPENDPGVVVYPVPSSGNITIKGNGIKKVDVYTVAGRLVCSPLINDKNTAKADLSFLSPGIYFMHIETVLGEKVIKKIVIER